MKKLIKINTSIGWTLLIGIITTQLIITKVTYDMGRMAPFIAMLTLILFIPFTITAIAGILDRKRQLNKIENGIKTGLFFQVVLPIFLPLLFDKELIYLSLAGLFLGILMWYYRKKIETQLLILNGIGIIIWLLISIMMIMNF